MLVLFSVGCSGVDDSPMPAADMGMLTDRAISETTDADTGEDMAQTAPSASVGFRESMLTYAPLGSPRTLPLYFWYPSSDAEGPAVRYNGFLMTDGAYKDTSVSELSDMPVLLFSHGSRGMGAASIPYMAEYFARSGWLVVSWEHPGDTTTDGSDADLTFLHRPLDVSAVIDHLFDENATHPFVRQLSDHIVLSGWSRGGYTALAVGGARYDLTKNDENCAGDEPTDFCFAYRNHRDRFAQGFADPRVDGLILLTPGDYRRFQDGISTVDIPTLMWTASDDLNTPNEQDGDPIWSALSGDNKFRFEVEGAGHFTFSSLCPIAGPLGINNGCDDDAFSIENAHELVNEYSLQFTNGWILGDDDARLNVRTLTPQAIGYDEVTFETKASQ